MNLAMLRLVEFCDCVVLQNVPKKAKPMLRTSVSVVVVVIVNIPVNEKLR